MQISKVLLNQSKYPDQLRELASPPKQLYVLGQLPNQPVVAIVGTRKPTSYGKAATYQLAGELANAGLTIVSGLAYGIDGIAHQGALDAGGQTIAVLAGGLDRIYPAGHQQLAQKIIDSGGGLISEYDLGTPSLRYNFVARNRIVSGLALATIITEAASESGSLITANYAIEQNRRVMAVPGNITSLMSAGPNNLIRTGAVPVTNSNDVLSELDLTSASLPALAQPRSRDQALILDLLKQGHNTSDALIKASAMEASQFANIITLMEITGQVRNLGAGNWVAR